jgi:hypothetical protein
MHFFVLTFADCQVERGALVGLPFTQINQQPIALRPPSRGRAFRVIRDGTAKGPLIPANLSLLCALQGTPYLPKLLGLPLLNYLMPELMARRVGGFTLSWLVLGVLFFPYVWVIAWVFIKRSIALERDEVAAVQRETKP